MGCNVEHVARTLLKWVPVSGGPVGRKTRTSNPSHERRAGVQVGNLVRVGNLVPGKPILAPAIRRGPVATGSLQPRSRAEGTRRRSQGARRENPEEAKPAWFRSRVWLTTTVAADAAAGAAASRAATQNALKHFI